MEGVDDGFDDLDQGGALLGDGVGDLAFLVEHEVHRFAQRHGVKLGGAGIPVLGGGIQQGRQRSEGGGWTGFARGRKTRRLGLGERDGSPDAGTGERLHAGPRPFLPEAPGHVLGEGRIIEQHAAVEDKVDGLAGFGQVPCTGGRVGGQGFGGFREDSPGEGIALGGSPEDRDGEAGHVGFIGLDGPVDQVVRHIECQGIEDQRAQFWPSAGTVGLGDEGPQGFEADFGGAAPVANDMAPAAGFGGAPFRGAAITTGAGAAEHQHAGRHARFLRGRGERGFEIVGGEAGDLGKNTRGGAADPVAILIGTGAGESYRNGPQSGDRAGQASGNFPEPPLQFAVGEEF